LLDGFVHNINLSNKPCDAYLSSVSRFRIEFALDNYRIHTSKITQAALLAFGGRVVLHFLPPYCPNENKIERLWLDLHGEVTRNHKCGTMEDLMRNVRDFVQPRLRRPYCGTYTLAA
jgi:transposase